MTVVELYFAATVAAVAIWFSWSLWFGDKPDATAALWVALLWFPLAILATAILAAIFWVCILWAGNAAWAFFWGAVSGKRRV